VPFPPLALGALNEMYLGAAYSTSIATAKEVSSEISSIPVIPVNLPLSLNIKSSPLIEFFKVIISIML
jgi:hypothetical protein